MLHRFNRVGFYGYACIYDKLPNLDLTLNQKIMVTTLMDGVDIGSSVAIPISEAKGIDMPKVIRVTEQEMARVVKYDHEMVKKIQAFHAVAVRGKRDVK